MYLSKLLKRWQTFLYLFSALLLLHSEVADAQQSYLVQPAVATYAVYGSAPTWYLYDPFVACVPWWQDCHQWHESRDAETLCRYAIEGGTFAPEYSNCPNTFNNEWYWVNSQIHVARVDTQYYSGPVCRYWKEMTYCRPQKPGEQSSGWRDAGISVQYSCPDATWTRMSDVCYKALPNPDTDDCSVGNPIDPSIESKRSTEIDAVFIDSGKRVPVTREFSSRSLVQPSGALGFGWRLMPWERRLQFIRGYLDPLNVISLRTASSTVTFARPTAGFAETGSGWTQQNTRPAIRISRRSAGGVSTEWTVKDEAGLLLEVYSADGRLNLIQHSDGRTESLIYSSVPAPRPGNLMSITLASGRSIEFTYSPSGEISTIELPARAPAVATTLTYGYEQRVAPVLLSRTVAGETLTYLYEDQRNPLQTTLPADLYVVTPQPSWPRYPWWFCSYYCPAAIGKATLNTLSTLTAPRSAYSLTGIIDEKGNRTATYTYDAQGRAITTERAGGTNKYSINYISPTSVSITDPLNTVRTRTYQTINGVVRSTNETQPPGSGSGTCSRTGTFDSAGNPISRLDFSGNKICYVYDGTRGLEIKRVEGLPSTADCTTALTNPPAGARVISTEWHPNWRLPTRVAEPNKITRNIFNGQGATCAPAAALVDGSPVTVMCSRSEQATTDSTGAAGFSAAIAGTPRTWNYTYTTYGRVLTALDPNNRTATYAYYPDNDPDLGRRGNVATITNAKNQLTQFAAYDLRGLPTQIIDPNGLVFANTYNHRLQLTRQQAGNEVTVLAYDPTGRLQNVLLPEGASLTYTYDAAHRLAAINDHKGNRIDYILDAMGNRTAEQLRDSGGTLAKNIARVIDALNRVQQVTGSVQ